MVFGVQQNDKSSIKLWFIQFTLKVLEVLWKGATQNIWADEIRLVSGRLVCTSSKT